MTPSCGLSGRSLVGSLGGGLLRRMGEGIEDPDEDPNDDEEALEGAAVAPCPPLTRIASPETANAQIAMREIMLGATRNGESVGTAEGGREKLLIFAEDPILPNPIS
jgi:hypothetical protein